MDSLRDRQINSIVQLLNLNNANKGNISSNKSYSYYQTSDDNYNNDEDAEDETIWKILIFDDYCRDIVSTLLKVSDLRESGITVHMLLDSPRSKLSDVPAVYFVQPTLKNIQRITEDMVGDLYDLYYLNFASSIPRTLLEEIAVTTVASKTAHQIAQVVDKYSDYISPEESMFTLGISDAYKIIHDPTTSDSDNQKLVEQIINSLFSVLVTLKTVPVICAAKGGAAEIIATRLNQKIRDHTLHNKTHLLSDSTGEGWCGGTTNDANNRAVLILLDRDIDLATMLSHSWNYQPLIHDVLGIELNRVNISIEHEGKVNKKSYDLDAKDEFWKRLAPLPFPEAASEIDEDSTLFKKEADEITRIGGVNSLDDIQNLDFGANTKQLQKAISMLPQLTARKSHIDMHMNIATAILEIIKSRQLDVLFQVEESIAKQNKQTILEMINNEKCGTPMDKLRVFIIYLLFKQQRSQSNSGGGSYSDSNFQPGQSNKRNISIEGMPEFEAALLAAGSDNRPLEYLKKLQSLTKMTIPQASSSPATTVSSDFLGKFTSIGSKLTNIKDGAGLGDLFAGVRSFLPKSKDLPIAQIVKSIMEGNPNSPSLSGSSRFGDSGNSSSGNNISGILGLSKQALQNLGLDNGVVILDPLQTKPVNSYSNPSARTSSPFQSANSGRSSAFKNAIVFTVGGGNYLEYQNLMDYASRSSSYKNIIYGSTDIVSPEQFLAQLAALDSVQG